MKLIFHKNFKKQYKKLRTIQKQVDKRLILFISDQFNPILNNHTLAGKYKGHRSINISGDYRAIYRFIDDNTAFFKTIDKHNKLYK